jgi:hypothetical protein
MRFCIYYMKLYAVTVRDSYPLPRMDERIDSLGDASVFSTLDCNSGYWQIQVAPVDMEKANFTSRECSTTNQQGKMIDNRGNETV